MEGDAVSTVRKGLEQLMDSGSGRECQRQQAGMRLLLTRAQQLRMPKGEVLGLQKAHPEQHLLLPLLDAG